MAQGKRKLDYVGASGGKKRKTTQSAKAIAKVVRSTVVKMAEKKTFMT